MENHKHILLKVTDLVVALKQKNYFRTLVDGVSYEVNYGEKIAMVGESGSGKTLSALAVMGLLAKSNGWHIGGEICFQGQSHLQLDERKIRKWRGCGMTMIFQEPVSALNPVMSCGYQILEMFTVHYGWSKKKAREATLQLLREMRFPDPLAIARAYPHELSGGMRQRIALAIAMAVWPKLIIADEPVSMLDAENRQFIFDFLIHYPATQQSGLLFITHDFRILHNFDRILVIYASRPVEYAPAGLLLGMPNHPYTKKLLALVVQTDQSRLSEIPGQMLSPDQYYFGCHFAERCEKVMPVCKVQKPIWREIGTQHYSACWLNE